MKYSLIDSVYSNTGHNLTDFQAYNHILCVNKHGQCESIKKGLFAHAYLRPVFFQFSLKKLRTSTHYSFHIIWLFCFTFTLSLDCINPIYITIIENEFPDLFFRPLQLQFRNMSDWLDWVCLTTTRVLQDILAVLHRLMCLKSCFHPLNSCPIQVNVSQSCFHSLNNYSSVIILSMSGG